MESGGLQITKRVSRTRLQVYVSFSLIDWLHLSQVHGGEQSAALPHRPRRVDAADARVQVHRPCRPLLLRPQHPQVLGGRGE